MGALWLPSDDELVVAQREPNLLVPGRKPVGNTVARDESFGRVAFFYAMRHGRFRFDDASRHTRLVDFTYTPEQSTDDAGQVFLNPAAFYTDRWTNRPSQFTVFTRVMYGTSNYGFAFCQSFSSSYDFALYRNGSSQVTTYFGSNNSGGTSQLIYNNTWTNLALVVDGSNVYAYCTDNAGASSYALATSSYSAANSASAKLGINARGASDFADPGHSTQYVGAVERALSQSELDRLFSDPYGQLLRPANQSPFLISIPGGGGAAYDETFSASASSAFTLSDSWALNYAETFGASAASGAELTDSYQTPSANYDETFAASAASGAELADAWSLDYSETFAATAASGATLTDAWLLNYAETFAAASAAAFTLTDAWALDYAETFAASAASGCDLAHSYAAGNNYAETFAASSVSVATLTHAYSVQYAETFAAQALADCTLVAAWALDYAETFAASSATDCVLTDAYGTPAPGAFDETFAAAAVSACDLTHAFSTPAAIGRVINPTLAASGVPARTLKGLKLIN